MEKKRPGDFEDIASVPENARAFQSHSKSIHENNTICYPRELLLWLAYNNPKNPVSFFKISGLKYSSESWTIKSLILMLSEFTFRRWTYYSRGSHDKSFSVFSYKSQIIWRWWNIVLVIEVTKYVLLNKSLQLPNPALVTHPRKSGKNNNQNPRVSIWFECLLSMHAYHDNHLTRMLQTLEDRCYARFWLEALVRLRLFRIDNWAENMSLPSIDGQADSIVTFGHEGHGHKSFLPSVNLVGHGLLSENGTHCYVIDESSKRWKVRKMEPWQCYPRFVLTESMRFKQN